MNSVASDRRFTKAFTDPRFKPMPTFKTKVKIDKRFKAVLSSKDYGHRLVVDKRGRPIHDLAKRGKHEMERYYQISSDDSSSSDNDDEVEEDDDEENQDSRLAQSQSEDVSEAESESDSPVAKPLKKKKEEDLTHEKTKIKRKKSDGVNNENDLISKSPLKKKVKTVPEKKKSSQKVSEDHIDVERPAAKRLKKREEVTPDKKKASKKRALAEEDDEEDRFSVKRLKKTEEVLSDKKKASKKQALAEEDDGERFSVKRLKKTEEVLSEKKKSSNNKKSVKEKVDDRLEERPLVKMPKKKVEVVSDDDDEEEEEIDEEEMSSDSDESDSDEDEEAEEDDWEEEDDSRFISVVKQSIDVDHSWNELHKQAPIVSESTHRLAVCNMDWDFVKAQDLFVLFKSFATDSGSIRSVTIYPSEFGKERIVEDAVMGPRELRRDLTGDSSQSESEDSESEDERKKKKKGRSIDSEILKRKAQEEAKTQNEALRGYQLNRLRYYFAVVDCNSVETADALYKECDGMEYQLSSIQLDLRFIPDDMTFDDPPKDSFADEQVLVDFTPNEFHSTALSRGKVNATWDETEFDRIRNKITNAPREELEQIVEDNLYADTIAPPESDSDSEDGGERPQWLTEALDSDEEEDEEEIDEEKKISLYRKVLMDKLVADEEKEKVKKHKASEIDKEVEWTAGLKTAYESKLRRNEKIKEESQGVIVDKYLERRREKRRNRLQKKTDTAKSGEGASDEDNDQSGINDLPDIIDDSLKEMMESEGRDVNGIKSKKKKKKADKKKSSKEDEVDEEAERKKAELELLLMRDDDEKKIAKPEKVKEKLSRRQKKKLSMQKSEKRKQRREGRLTLDVADERFSAMFTSHHFHLDPNHGQFRKTKNNMELVNEQIKRMSKKSKKEVSNNYVDNNTDAVEDSRSVSKKLVESLKSKMKK